MGYRRLRVSIGVLERLLRGETQCLVKTNVPSDLMVEAIVSFEWDFLWVELLVASEEWREVPAEDVGDIPLFEAVYLRDPDHPHTALTYAPWIGAAGAPPGDLLARDPAGGTS